MPPTRAPWDSAPVPFLISKWELKSAEAAEIEGIEML